MVKYFIHAPRMTMKARSQSRKEAYGSSLCEYEILMNQLETAAAATKKTYGDYKYAAKKSDQAKKQWKEKAEQLTKAMDDIKQHEKFIDPDLLLRITSLSSDK